jgi:homoserine dehydrogenase
MTIIVTTTVITIKKPVILTTTTINETSQDTTTGIMGSPDTFKVISSQTAKAMTTTKEVVTKDKGLMTNHHITIEMTWTGSI